MQDEHVARPDRFEKQLVMTVKPAWRHSLGTIQAWSGWPGGGVIRRHQPSSVFMH